MLTGAQNGENGFCFDFLGRYHKDSNALLNRIVRVTGDKTWISFVSVEIKEQSKQRMHTHSSNRSRKFKRTLFARKLTGTLFWDRKRVLMVEFMQQGTTITSNAYCETLKNLRRAIQKKTRGMLTFGVVLLHDNERPHTAACARALLEHFSWELFDHHLCSPDLTPRDYHLFTYLQNWLESQYLNNNEELMEGVKTWLSSQAADFFDTGEQKFISDTRNASIPAMTKLKSSISMYVSFLYNKIFCLFC
jgi:hypothetical protein